MQVLSLMNGLKAIKAMVVRNGAENKKPRLKGSITGAGESPYF